MASNDLPVFPEEVTSINWGLDFGRDGDSVFYFFKGMPVFAHGPDDLAAFRMITAKFCVDGHAEELEIARAFAVSPESVRLAVELYREKGRSGFYPAPAVRSRPGAPAAARARRVKLDKTK